MSDLEDELAFQLKAAKLFPEREVRFCARRWRWDFAWPAKKVAVEVEGGIWSGGRHARGGGIESGIEKRNAGLLLGWRVLQVTAKHVNSGDALSWIEQLLVKG